MTDKIFPNPIWLTRYSFEKGEDKCKNVKNAQMKVSYSVGGTNHVPCIVTSSPKRPTYENL